MGTQKGYRIRMANQFGGTKEGTAVQELFQSTTTPFEERGG
jgi:hypothetical protein